MRGHKEVLEYRCGSPGLLTHDKWIALPRRMALGWNHVSSNYRVFQQNTAKADIRLNHLNYCYRQKRTLNSRPRSKFIAQTDSLASSILCPDTSYRAHQSNSLLKIVFLEGISQKPSFNYSL